VRARRLMWRPSTRRWITGVRCHSSHRTRRHSTRLENSACRVKGDPPVFSSTEPIVHDRSQVPLCPEVDAGGRGTYGLGHPFPFVC